MDAFGNTEPASGAASARAGSVAAPRAPRRGLRRWTKLVLCALAAALFSAGLYAVYTAMSDVLRSDGGFCASGGPYVIAHQCGGADTRTLAMGILAVLAGGALFAGFSAWADGPLALPGLCMWSALFGSLGWNFVRVQGHGGGGQLITGLVFLTMAAGGALPVLATAARWLSRRGALEPPPPHLAAIVHAVAHPSPEPARALVSGPSRIVVEHR